MLILSRVRTIIPLAKSKDFRRSFRGMLRQPIVLLLIATVVAFEVDFCDAQTAAKNLPHAATNQQTFEVKGVVKKLPADGVTVVIRHEQIPNYMPAMTMPFEVRDTNELRGLQAGDAVSFRMVVASTDAWIDHITKLDVPNPTNVPPPHLSFR